jgi:hypothetical protein
MAYPLRLQKVSNLLTIAGRYANLTKSDISTGLLSRMYWRFGKMNENHFVRVSAAALVAVCCLCIAQSAFAGSIVGWGSIAFDSEKLAANDFVAIAAGGAHSLALKADGSILGWGDNSYGQATPPAGNDFVAIVAGSYHSLALKSDGSIVGWGSDYCGRVYPDWGGQATPPDGNDFVAIAPATSTVLP